LLLLVFEKKKEEDTLVASGVSRRRLKKAASALSVFSLSLSLCPSSACSLRFCVIKEKVEMGKPGLSALPVSFFCVYRYVCLSSRLSAYWIRLIHCNCTALRRVEYDSFVKGAQIGQGAVRKWPAQCAMFFGAAASGWPRIA
jgi:hypothetical protein